jgi:hypothetical protein
MKMGGVLATDSKAAISAVHEYPLSGSPILD